MSREIRVHRRDVIGGLAGLALNGRACPAASSQRTPRIDGLSFLPEEPADLKSAGLDAFICDVSAGEWLKDSTGNRTFVRTFEACDAALDAALERIAKELPHARIALRGSELRGDGTVRVVLQFQSTEPIDTDLSRIGYFHSKGLRVLQLTHHRNTALAGGSLEPVPTGLTALGVEGVSEMNRLRVVVDVAHASQTTTMDVARHTKAPFILSHGACRAIVENPRCASDHVIRALADRGGVMGIFMMSFWLTTADVPTPEHYLAHIRHVIRVGGVDAVGIANDYPMAGHAGLKAVNNDNSRGVAEYHDWWKSVRARGVQGYERLPRHAVIPDFNDIRRVQRIRDLLERSRMPGAHIDKIMGGNWRRVLMDVLG